MKISSKKEKPIPRINQAFAKLVNDNGTQTEAGELLGFRSQDIGYYMKDRKIPPELISACRKKYGYDLLELEEMDFENMVLKKKESFERVVSRETKQRNVPQLSDRDIIEAQNYIGMHRRVYDSLEKSLEMFQKLAVDAQRNANDLTQILAGRSGPGSGPPQG